MSKRNKIAAKPRIHFRDLGAGGRSGLRGFSGGVDEGFSTMGQGAKLKGFSSSQKEKEKPTVLEICEARG